MRLSKRKRQREKLREHMEHMEEVIRLGDEDYRKAREELDREFPGIDQRENDR